jgi:hypothetical protein
MKLKVVVHEAEEGGYWAEVPAIPGCATQGETFEELLNKFMTQGPAYEAPAEQAYRIAFMLEDAHYHSNAFRYYLNAATLAPDNVLYRSTLMSFKKDYEIK